MTMFVHDLHPLDKYFSAKELKGDFPVLLLFPGFHHPWFAI